jgi:hypothetical protein
MDERGVRRGSWVYPIQEDPDYHGVFSAAPFLHGHYKTKLTANSCIVLCSSTNAVNISSLRTIKRFPSSRCASAIQLVGIAQFY